MIVKEHKTSEGKIIISICDSDILGQKFEQGDLQIDASSNFYKGEEKSEAGIKEIIKKAYIVNAVGKRSVEFCISQGFIDKKSVIVIAGIPHAECIIVKEE